MDIYIIYYIFYNNNNNNNNNNNKMGTRAIYVDDEMNEVLKSLRIKDPTFNFSGFIKEKLIGRTGSFGEDEGEDIKHNIETEQSKAQFHLDNVEFWEKKLERWKIHLEEKKEQEAEQVKLLLEKEAKDKEKMDNIKKEFAEEVGREMSEQELNTYLTGKFPNIYSFCEHTQQLKGGNTQ